MPDEVKMPSGTVPEAKGAGSPAVEGKENSGVAFKNDPAVIVERDTLKGKVGDLEGKVKEMSELLANPEVFGKMFGNAAEVGGTPAAEAKPEEKPDLNNMSGEQLASTIIKSVEGMLDNKLGGISKTVNAQGERQAFEKVAALYKACEKAHPDDFETLKPKMLEISQKVRGIDPESCYRLAKMQGMEEESARKVKAEEDAKAPSKPESAASQQKVLSVEEAVSQEIDKMGEKIASGNE